MKYYRIMEVENLHPLSWGETYFIIEEKKWWGWKEVGTYGTENEYRRVKQRIESAGGVFI